MPTGEPLPSLLWMTTGDFSAVLCAQFDQTSLFISSYFMNANLQFIMRAGGSQNVWWAVMEKFLVELRKGSNRRSRSPLMLWLIQDTSDC